MKAKKNGAKLLVFDSVFGQNQQKKPYKEKIMFRYKQAGSLLANLIKKQNAWIQDGPGIRSGRYWYEKNADADAGTRPVPE